MYVLMYVLHLCMTLEPDPGVTLSVFYRFCFSKNGMDFCPHDSIMTTIAFNMHTVRLHSGSDVM